MPDQNIVQEMMNTANDITIATNNEERAKEEFDRRNAQITTTLNNHTENNEDLDENLTGINNTADIVSDIDPAVSEYALKYSELVASGNPASFALSQTLLADLNDKITSDDYTEYEKEYLQELSTYVENTSINLSNNPDINEQYSSWNSAKITYSTAQTEKDSEISALLVLRDQDPEAFEIAKTKLDTASRQALDSALDRRDPLNERSTGNLDADSIASQNKFLVSSLSDPSQSLPPFYLQFPTIKTITDFHLRNGFSPYGQQSPSDVARDAIHVNIFKGELGNMTEQIIPGTTMKTMSLQNASESVMGSFTIYPNNPDWLQMSHNHTYSDENPLAFIANPMLQFVNTTSNLLGAVNNLAGGKDYTKVTRRFDFIDQYQTTEKIQLNIPFILFTKGDFINDIFNPIMFLTALSYPQRLSEDPLAGQITDSTNLILNSLGGEGTSTRNEDELTTTQKTIKSVGQFGSEGADKVNDIVQKYGNMGAFRYIITQRPEYLSIRHASGLFFFKLAVITNFSYAFKGPWINSTGDILSEQGAFNPNTASKVFNSFLSNRRRGKMPYAFPSIAECTIGIKAVEPMFRNDWLELLNAGDDSSGKGIVRVSETRTGTVNSEGKKITPINLEQSIGSRNTRRG